MALNQTWRQVCNRWVWNYGFYLQVHIVFILERRRRRCSLILSIRFSFLFSFTPWLVTGILTFVDWSLMDTSLKPLAHHSVPEPAGSSSLLHTTVTGSVTSPQSLSFLSSFLPLIAFELLLILGEPPLYMICSYYVHILRKRRVKELFSTLPPFYWMFPAKLF